MDVSLSRYYPPGTVHFTGYPLAPTRHCFVKLPGWALVHAAAKPLICAGPHNPLICYASAVAEPVWRLLRDELGTPLVPREQVLALPAELEPVELREGMPAATADQALRQAVRRLAPAGQLVMPAPWLDPDLLDRYQSDPERQLWLNDKRNLTELVPTRFVPERVMVYESGADFERARPELPCPCVVKVGNSGGGAGVRVCRTSAELSRAQRELFAAPGPIVVEQYVHAKRNVCVHFGIPWQAAAPTEILGLNAQLIDRDSTFVGSIVDACPRWEGLKAIVDTLSREVLPRLRALGYYGVGGFDVLVDENGKPFVIDANLRMTATLPYLVWMKNTEKPRSLVAFTAVFSGDEAALRRRVLSHAMARSGEPQLLVSSLARRESTFTLAAAIAFDQPEALPDIARELLSDGLRSAALGMLSDAADPTFSGY